MWANKLVRARNRNICRHTDIVWTQSEEYYGEKIIIIQCMMKQYKFEAKRKEKIWKERWRLKRFFSQSGSLPVYEIIINFCFLLMLVLFGTLKCAVWRIHSSRSVQPSPTMCSGYPFYASHSSLSPLYLQESNLQPYPSVYVFSSREIGLSTLEYEAQATKIINYSGNIKQPRGLLQSLNLNAVKALTLLRSCHVSLTYNLQIEGLRYIGRIKHTITANFLRNGN